MKKALYMLKILLAAFIDIVLYIILHEGGHALIAVSCGAKVTAFSIVGAYTSSEGGNYTQTTLSLLNLAGVIFPIIVSVCYVTFFFRRDREGVFYRVFSMFFIFIPTMSLLAWVIVPIAFMAGDTANPDDVIQFLNISGIHPVIVMIFAFMLFVGIIVVAWKKGVFQIWIDMVTGKLFANPKKN